MRGAIKADALDVSIGGMFVRPHVALELGTTLNFSVVLDDGGAPIAGRAKVVRQISETRPQRAACAGLRPRHRRDGARPIACAGSGSSRGSSGAPRSACCRRDAARLAELQAGLAGCGYAVVGGTDPGALVQLANADARPGDAVLIDAGWLQNGASATLVESLFAARNVPCVTMHGEARRARQAIDRLLEVVGVSTTRCRQL